VGNLGPRIPNLFTAIRTRRTHAMTATVPS
jgi:hypothetical protein